MADHSATYTQTRANAALLRLQGLTLSAMVAKGWLTGASAAGLVRDAAGLVQHPSGSEMVEREYAELFEQLAQDLEGSRP